MAVADLARSVSVLTVRHVLEVDVGVAQRSSGDHVAANADGQHGANGAEFLEQHCFRHVRVQIAHVQRSHREFMRRVLLTRKNTRKDIQYNAPLVERERNYTRNFMNCARDTLSEI